MKKIFTLLAAAAVSLGAFAQNYTATGSVIEYPSWGDNLFAGLTATVESYDGYVIVRDFAGVAGYDIQVAYDADWNVVGITPTTKDGEVGTEVTSGYCNCYTGLTGDDEYYCMAAYVGSGYGYVYDNGSDAGYVLLGAYYYNNDGSSVWACYYVEWPVAPNYTAEAAVTEYDDWGDNLFAGITTTVESYDGYVIVRDFAGVAGYDIQVAYDADWNVIGITPTTKDGEVGTEVTSGYCNCYTGLNGDDEYYCMAAYVGSGYGYVYDNGSDAGYVLLGVYYYNNDGSSVWACYYVEWPVAEPGETFEALAQITTFGGQMLGSYNCTVTAYESGMYGVNEFLGENYYGASFKFNVDGQDIIFVDVPEETVEDTDVTLSYLEIWDYTTEQYIYPYIYDTNSVWGEYAGANLSYNKEVEGVTWASHAYILMYSEDLVPEDAAYYGYVDIYWGNTGGVSSVSADENAAPVYYNLNGMQVENPSRGIYIVKQGSKVSKQVIR